MTQEYANKLVRRNFIALTLTLLFMALLTAGAVGMWWGAFGPPDFLRKDNTLLTPQAAELRLENGAKVIDYDIYTGFNNVSECGTYEKVEGSTAYTRTRAYARFLNALCLFLLHRLVPCACAAAG